MPNVNYTLIVLLEFNTIIVAKVFQFHIAQLDEYFIKCDLKVHAEKC